MPGNAAFPSPPSYIKNSSDKTSALKDSTIYKELARNVSAPGNHIAMVKNTGVMYQDNFFAKSCKDSNGAPAPPKLAAAKNFDLLRSVVKGKLLTNPTLDNAAARSLPTAQNGNHLRVKYGSDAVIKSLEFGNNPKMPVFNATNKMGAIGPDPDDFGTGTCWPRNGCQDLPAPSYVIDPSYTVFYNKHGCKSRSPWENSSLVDVSFQETANYWRSANAQPINDHGRTSAVIFTQQTPVKNTTNFPYPPRDVTDWCDKSGLV